MRPVYIIYIYRLDAKCTGFTSLSPLLGKFVSVEALTIADLRRFATTAVPQVIESWVI